MKKSKVSKIGRLFLIIICILTSLHTFVYAEDKAAQISAKEVKTRQGKEVEIPVEIKNNPGIMGFSITLSYPTESLEITKISQGDIIKSGSFNDSVGTGTESDGVKVLWSDTDEMKEDGTLFIITCKALEQAEDMKIGITYGQEDTFNEQYEDVAFTCSDIVLQISEKGAGNNRVFLYLGIVAGVILLILVIVLIYSSKSKKKRNKKAEQSWKTPEAPVLKKTAPHLKFQGSVTGIKGTFAGYTVELQKGECMVIGKDAKQANLIIEDCYEDISRKHCSIRYDKEMSLYEVTDYSLNGTKFPDERRLETGVCTMVPRGSRLILGNGRNVVRLD